MLSEQSAWLLLSRWCERARETRTTVRGITWRCVEFKKHAGLCTAVAQLWREERIDWRTYQQMIGRIHDHAPGADDQGYRWPCSLSGAKLRAEFCKGMAARCSAQVSSQKVTA